MSTERDRTRWLDDDEQRHWRAYLRATRLVEAALDRDLQAHGLQLPEYEIISMLSEARDRHLRMSEIADLVVQSRSRLTHTAARLEKRGWVARQPCEGDRRGVELVLTAAGQSAIAEMAPLHVESVRANLVDLLSGEQLAALGEAMAAVQKGLAGPTAAADRDERVDAYEGAHADRHGDGHADGQGERRTDRRTDKLADSDADGRRQPA